MCKKKEVKMCKKKLRYAKKLLKYCNFDCRFEMLQWFTLTLMIIYMIYLQNVVESCNEAVCGSIVSKCLLTQSCKCTMKDCTCCKECANCLNYLYTECCSCVGTSLFAIPGETLFS